MKIRVEFNEENLRPAGEDETPPEETAEMLHLPDISGGFVLENSNVPGYGPAAQRAQFALEVPEGDIARVESWFTGDTHGVTTLASEKLLKSLSASVWKMLDTWRGRAAEEGLMTEPRKLLTAYRLKDGTHVAPAVGGTRIFPNPECPPVEVVSGAWQGNTITIGNVIHGKASRLLWGMPAVDAPVREALAGIVTHVDLLTTVPEPIYNADNVVSGVHTVSYDSETIRVWESDTPGANVIAMRTTARKVWRVVASVPWSEASVGFMPQPVDWPAGMLDDVTLMPSVTLREVTDLDMSKYKDDTSEQPDMPPQEAEAVCFESEPLALGDKCRDKRVRCIELSSTLERGCLRLSLYGSTHRRDWRLVAQTRGAVMRGLSSRYRWWKIRVEGYMTPDDRIDALIVDAVKY